jgi:hypothetical protein
VRACIPDADVTRTQTFSFQMSGPAPALASLLLVCDRAFTDLGEDVYARLSPPVQTLHGPVSELKLDPSLTYPYMYPQPPEAQRNCPMWTLYLDEIISRWASPSRNDAATRSCSPTLSHCSAPAAPTGTRENCAEACTDPSEKRT